MAKSLDEALEVAFRTDTGVVREHNEDAVFADAARGLVILADGMGGYNAGEVASSMAVTLLSAELDMALSGTAVCQDDGDGGVSFVRRCLQDKIQAANAAIYRAAVSEPKYAGMGTTLVAALFHDNRVTVAHIGDSRLYRLRGEELTVLTRDHSLLQEQIDCGLISPEEARYSQHRNLVTRALGVDPVVVAEIHDYPAESGDIYLFCSDGLNDMVTDEDIHLTLQMLSVNLELAATQLVQMANDNGGRDNVSVVLVKVLRSFAASGGWQSCLGAWFK